MHACSPACSLLLCCHGLIALPAYNLTRTVYCTSTQHQRVPPADDTTRNASALVTNACSVRCAAPCPLHPALQRKARVSYFYDPEVGQFYYGRC